MTLKYKIRNALKNLPFYSKEINNLRKNNKKFNNARILSEVPFSPKKSKKLSNHQLSNALPFFPKRPKKLTKHQILKNILPLYDTVGITKSQRAFRNYAETYNVQVVDKESLSDSYFTNKSYFKNMQQCN